MSRKIIKPFSVIVLVLMSCLLFSCSVEQEILNHLEISENSPESIINYISANTVRGVNQNNNIQYWGFSVMVEEYIFFADGLGIHRTNRLFENIETLVLNKNLLGNPTAFDTFNMQYLSMFRGLQYYDNRIYFLDQRNFTIYSMDIYGNNILPILSASEIAQGGKIADFILANNKIYFYYFTGDSDGRLKSFNIETRKIIDFGIRAFLFSLSPDSRELHFDYDMALTALNLEDETIHDRMPHNIQTLLWDNRGILGIITNRTISDGRIFFSAPSARNSMILVINEDGYAEELYTRDEGIIDFHINSVNEWIYFTVTYWDERVLHMYRIRNDGSGLEVVYENLVVDFPGMQTIFINIFSEDIILFQRSPTFHNIYALLRNPETDELEMKHINPIN